MIKISKFFNLKIIFSTLIMSGMLLIIPFQIMGGYTFRFFVGAIGFFLFIFCAIMPNKPLLYSRIIHRIHIILIPYLLSVIISIIYTSIIYSYSLYEIIISLIPYMFMFFTYPLSYCIVVIGMRKFMKNIALITTVFLFIKFIIWISYNKFGITLFPNMLFEFGSDWIRNNYLRVNPGYLTGISFSYYLAEFFYSERKPLIAGILCFYIYFILVCSAFRFQFLVLVLISLISFLYSKKSISSKVVKILLYLLVGFFVIFSPTFTKFINSFSVSNENTGGSSLLRILTIQHFWNYIVKNHLFLGVGMLIQENENALLVLTKSQWRLFYLEDIGVLGGIFKFGLLSIGIYLSIYIYALKSYKMINFYDKWKRIFIISIISYFLLSNLILNIYDLQRAFDVPFYISIFICSKIQEEENIRYNFKNRIFNEYNNKLIM